MLRVGSSKKLHFFGLISVGCHLELEQGRSSIQKKCFSILKPYIFMVKLVAKCYLNWNFFSQQPFYCVRFSNIEYRDEIFKAIIKSDGQKVMAKYSFWT